MKFETIETDRLLLKKLTPEVFSELFKNCSEKEVIQILGLTDHDDFLKEKEKSDGGYKTYDRSIVAFSLVIKETNETIGRCGFHNWYGLHRRAELGYWIFKDEHKQKGYMDEAVKRILAYGFKEMNLNRIEACVGPENHASLRIIQKNGFNKEGYLKQHYMRDEILEDTIIFSLLKADYNSTIEV